MHVLDPTALTTAFSSGSAMGFPPVPLRTKGGPITTFDRFDDMKLSLLGRRPIAQGNNEDTPMLQLLGQS